MSSEPSAILRTPPAWMHFSLSVIIRRSSNGSAADWLEINAPKNACTSSGLVSQRNLTLPRRRLLNSRSRESKLSRCSVVNFTLSPFR